jgi:hypothetical protein
MTTVGNITAAYSGVNKSASLTVNPAAPTALSSLTLNPSTLVGGASATGAVTLTKAAPAGAISQVFTITTMATKQKANVSIAASYASVNKRATLTIIRR